MDNKIQKPNMDECIRFTPDHLEDGSISLYRAHFKGVEVKGDELILTVETIDLIDVTDLIDNSARRCGQIEMSDQQRFKSLNNQGNLACCRCERKLCGSNARCTF